jgi:phosphoserine aminotransferase
MKKYNFSPGPAMLPQIVLEEASQGLIDYDNTGLSVAEISHRSPLFLNIIEEATALVKEIHGIKDEYDVLWLPGGASAQMAIAPMNLVDKGQNIATLETGFWAKRAITAAAQICKVKVLASSKDTNFDRIPNVKNWELPSSTRYFYVVSNETIEGIQFHQFPSVNVPLVADMTSDFLSRPLPLEKFGVIFASAQKNFGIAGITCVLIRKDMLSNHVKRVIPNIFNYRTHIEHHSLFHTCPTFPIYASLLALRWTKSQGGLDKIHHQNSEKARLLYDEIDQNPFFKPIAVKEDRSIMNVCFRGISPVVEAQFLTFTEQNNIVGIAGYPTVGGFRASIYNAMPLENIRILINAMQTFARDNEHTIR